MPLIRPGMRKPPPGFDAVADKLDEYEEEMKQAVQDESKGVVGKTTKPRRETKRSRPVPHGKTSEGEDEDGDNDPRDEDAHPERKVARKEGDSDGEASSPSPAPEPTEAEEAEAPLPPLWRVAQINQARTRYVFNACFRERRVSKEVYDYCCEMNFIDGGLAKRWRLPGYERLCCMACGVPGSASVAANIASKFALRDKQERKVKGSAAASSSADKATCICRVPAAQRKNKSFLACAVCGCKGCCSADVAPPE